MSFVAITFSVASQRVIPKVRVYLSTQSGNFWIHRHTLCFRTGRWREYL